MNVFTGPDNIITSLGFNTQENLENIRQGISGIKIWEDDGLYPGKMAASRVDDGLLAAKVSKIFSLKGWHPGDYTRMEQMFMLSILDVLDQYRIDVSATKVIFSTTKGNIDLLDKKNKELFPKDRLLLWKMAEVISQTIGFSGKPMIVSNACISGSMAIIAAARMIRSGKCDHVIVTGGDMVTEFVASGFQSFQALSPGVCMPFDANRDGLSLGEGVGTLLLTSDEKLAAGSKKIHVAGGSVSNDANHISGPSRDGEGLWLAIEASMKEAGVPPEEVDFVSAHGTATPYNDEMEAKALAWGGLHKSPVNSFKGYFGHTLGAAGIIESILTIRSMQENLLIKSLGYSDLGVSIPLNIITQNQDKNINCTLKTASGFGGCNAGIVFKSLEF